jgi:hypothetical protein
MARLPLIAAMVASMLAAPAVRQSQTAIRTLPPEHRRIDAEGAVSDVTCAGVEMRLKIAAPNGTFRLHARDYTRVDIYEDVPFQAGEFKPCTELDGKTAKITFITVEHKTYDGEIQTIEVEAKREAN